MPTTDSTRPSRVRFELTGNLAEVVLDRPETSNAIDLEMASQLYEALERAQDDGSVSVVLLRGEGRLFCGGGDLASMASADDRPAHVAALAEAVHRSVRLLDQLQKPVVVAVQGAAAGVGFSLALGADLVVATESARFVTAYTSVGLTPDGGMSWLLPRVVGQQRAADLLLTGRPLGAAEAQALGIVTVVCQDSGLRESALHVASGLAGRPRHALASTRELLRGAWNHTLAEHLDLETRAISAVSGTEEALNRIASFLARD